MICPLEKPNLPQGKVTSVAISEKASLKLLNKLNNLCIETIKISDNPEIDIIGHHADISILNIAKNELIISDSQKENIVNFLTKGYRLKTIPGVKSPYPYDCKLNCAIIGEKVICNPATVPDEIISLFHLYNYKIINVKQGYSKCSVCVVSDSAIITDDESIYYSCSKNGMDTLLVNKGSIKLTGYNYGFIGGCTGLIDNNKLLFNGDINFHKNCNDILDFINRHGVEPVIIKDEPLTDIGSIIPLCEDIYI